MTDADSNAPAAEAAFSQEEYATRIARTRSAMDRHGIDVLLVHDIANVCYLSGYQTPLCDWYHCLVVPRHGNLILQVCDEELAQINTTVSTIVGVDWERMEQAAPALARLLRDQGFARACIGVESRRPGIDPYTECCLREQLADARFIDASSLITQIRAVKSAAEIDYLRQAARISDHGMEAAIAQVADGSSDNDICAAAAESMMRQGSEYFCIDPIVRTGWRSSITHGTAKRRPVMAGDPVLIELGGVYQRYCSPLLRTAVFGRPSADLQKLTDVSLGVMDLLFKELTPGRTLDEVACAAATRLLKLDPAVRMRGYFGYSVGIGFPPTWVERSLEIAEGRSDELEPGMVFHTHRSMRIPGVMGVGFSETVLITPTGCELLTQHPRKLWIRD